MRIGTAAWRFPTDAALSLMDQKTPQPRYL